jgi:hypothetical protein
MNLAIQAGGAGCPPRCGYPPRPFSVLGLRAGPGLGPDVALAALAGLSAATQSGHAVLARYQGAGALARSAILAAGLLV